MYSQDINHNNIKKAPIVRVTKEQLDTIRIGNPPQLSKMNPSAPKKAEEFNSSPRLIINK